MPYLGHSYYRRPALPEHVQANGAASVHVAMVDARDETDLRRLERIRGRETDVQAKVAALIDSSFRPIDDGRPVIEILGLYLDATVRRRMFADLVQLVLEAPHVAQGTVTSSVAIPQRATTAKAGRILLQGVVNQAAAHRWHHGLSGFHVGVCVVNIHRIWLGIVLLVLGHFFFKLGMKNKSDKLFAIAV